MIPELEHVAFVSILDVIDAKLRFYLLYLCMRIYNYAFFNDVSEEFSIDTCMRGVDMVLVFLHSAIYVAR